MKFSDNVVQFVSEISAVFSINVDSFLRYIVRRECYDIPETNSASYTYNFRIARDGIVSTYRIVFHPRLVPVFIDYYINSMGEYSDAENNVFSAMLLQFTENRVARVLSKNGRYNRRNIEEAKASALEIMFNSHDQILIDIPRKIEYHSDIVRQYEKTKHTFQLYTITFDNHEIVCICNDRKVAQIRVAIAENSMIRIRTGLNKRPVYRGTCNAKWYAACSYAGSQSIASELGLAERKMSVNLNHCVLRGSEWYDRDPKGYEKQFKKSAQPALHLVEFETLEQIEANSDELFTPSIFEIASLVEPKLDSMQQLVYNAMAFNTEKKMTNEDLAMHMKLSMRKIKEIRAQIKRIAQSTARRLINKNIKAEMEKNPKLKGGLEKI